MTSRPPLVDSTLLLLLEGYAWLPERRRRSPDGIASVRVMGRRALGLCGPDAVRFFYDPAAVRRHGALPEPVVSTLLGRGAVHTLDGETHRRRKLMFMAAMTPESIATLVALTATAWDDAVESWAREPGIVLFDEAARVLTRAACAWAGVPPEESDGLAADLVAMADGFATAGPRQLRARIARRRRERRFAALVERIRSGAAEVPKGSASDLVVHHRGLDGRPLDSRTAAVELLNLVRPVVAVAWYVAFAAHAMHRWPEQRALLRDGDPDQAEAFAQEIRRFYPFVPFLAGEAIRDLSWKGRPIPSGSLILIDVYGQLHDPELWPRPYTFAPARFLGREFGQYDLIPQGGGDPATGHRCPGEVITLTLLETLAVRLARLEYEMPPQNLSISLRRVPAKPRSGVVLSAVRPSRWAEAMTVEAVTEVVTEIRSRG
ncbi:cytochrome P450 [Spongiactinospora sp. TRM90649]|uniref:cytochrome P450 n=1 Tax=Spongiactinospora sp. TRM90649 TaxID=3031114 RepID=UPI0023F9B5C2|nr:cytochrome P450 [Spongiactinospora sp. TRM90649]MDF5755466.1 cytochrome P450 [Spongiactinospora sp. TRM90649]